MRKLFTFLGLILMSPVFVNSQTCGTKQPPKEWDEWFNREVKTFSENLQNGKSQPVVHTIPVVVHVIHYGETYGTYPNIDSNQILSQIVALNKDFAGLGDGVNQVPPAFANLVSNTNIKFCLATKTPSGGVMIERGANRISAVANSWTNPNTATLNVQDYFNTVIIPATIWDPNKYLNIWISDKANTYPLNGFATYPSGTSLNGLFNGTLGTVTNDGIWIWTKAFGTTGTLASPWNGGRTATHEIGHWLGLRHIWGDGNCLSDYCNDTPTAKQAHYGCVTSTPVDQCGVGSSPFGEMPMNFMDRTDDACKYMFTHDQNIRMQTAMSQCAYRNLLGTHAICTATPQNQGSSAPVASFNMPSTACLNQPVTPFNTSSGFPSPTYVWSSSPATQINPSSAVANPAITFNNPGSYTLTLVATNSVNSSSYSMVVNAQFTCQPFNLCVDSAKMVKNVDPLVSNNVPNPANNPNFNCPASPAFGGYLVGTNCYQDREFAQYFPPVSYSSTPNPQINSVLVLFNSKGTKSQLTGSPATTVTCRIRGGTVGGGPSGGYNNASRSDSLLKIAGSPQVASVGYLGIPGFAVANNIIPFKFNFPAPIPLVSPGAGFFACVEVPYNKPLDSVNIYHSASNSAIDSSAWYRQSNDIWRTFKGAQNRNANIQLAFIPQITCSLLGGLNEDANGLRQNFSIMPNPSTGNFSLVFTIPEEKDLTISVMNAIGKQVTANVIHNVSSSMINVDLAGHPDGIYFIEVSDGLEKVTRKVIIRR